MNAKRWVVQTGFVLLLPLLLLACGHHSKSAKTHTKTFTVNLSSSRETLHFTGIVQPLQENTITSPVDGVLEHMNYQFGQAVKKGAILFTLDSAALQKQYNDALTDYLKAKDNYSIAKTKFNGTEDLWQAGLIAKNNYLSEKSNLNTAHMTSMQAWHTLSELVDKTGAMSTHELYSLNLADFGKVQAALSVPHHTIQFKAPMNGILLYPPQGSDAKSGRISVGSAIKAGQALALIGDLSGIRVEIEIPEVDIDKIKPGLPAIIHGVAFNHDELKGVLTSITSQASTNSSGTLPTFQALIQVKSLSATQQQWIKAGMSATVELSTKRPEQLMIPIAAVQLVRGENIVHRRAADGTITEQRILTGAAKASMVSVVEGLNNGDVLVYE